MENLVLSFDLQLFAAKTFTLDVNVGEYTFTSGNITASGETLAAALTALGSDLTSEDTIKMSESATLGTSTLDFKGATIEISGLAAHTYAFVVNSTSTISNATIKHTGSDADSCIFDVSGDQAVTLNLTNLNVDEQAAHGSVIHVDGASKTDGKTEINVNSSTFVSSADAGTVIWAHSKVANIDVKLDSNTSITSTANNESGTASGASKIFYVGSSVSVTSSANIVDGLKASAGATVMLGAGGSFDMVGGSLDNTGSSSGKLFGYQASYGDATEGSSSTSTFSISGDTEKTLTLKSGSFFSTANATYTVKSVDSASSSASVTLSVNGTAETATLKAGSFDVTADKAMSINSVKFAAGDKTIVAVEGWYDYATYKNGFDSASDASTKGWYFTTLPAKVDSSTSGIIFNSGSGTVSADGTDTVVTFTTAVKSGEVKLTEQGDAKVTKIVNGKEVITDFEIGDDGTLIFGSDESGSDESGSDESGSDESGSDESGSDESGSDESGSDESGSDESGSDESGSDESGSDESGSDESGSDESGSDESGSDESGSDESGSDESGSDESGSDESGSDESGSDESGSDESGSDESGSDESGSDESDSDDEDEDDKAAAAKAMDGFNAAKDNNNPKKGEYAEVDDDEKTEQTITMADGSNAVVGKTSTHVYLQLNGTNYVFNLGKNTTADFSDAGPGARMALGAGSFMEFLGYNAFGDQGGITFESTSSIEDIAAWFVSNLNDFLSRFSVSNPNADTIYDTDNISEDASFVKLYTGTTNGVEQSILLGQTGNGSSVINTADYSELASENVMLVGNYGDDRVNGNASLKSGEGNDYVFAGNNDTVDAGAGYNNIYLTSAADSLDGEGATILQNAGYNEVVNFGSNDKLIFGSAVAGVSASNGNVVVGTEDSGKVTLTGSAGDVLNVEVGGVEYSAVVNNNNISYAGGVNYYNVSGSVATMSSSANNTSIFLDAEDGARFGDTKEIHGNIKTIDGKSIEGKATLAGSAEIDNVIYASKGGSSLWGGSGSSDDSLVGGAGKDTFFYRPGEGNDSIKGADSKDTVELNDMTLNDLNLDELEVTNNSVAISFKDGGSLTLNTNNGTKFHLDGVTYTYDKTSAGWKES